MLLEVPLDRDGGCRSRGGPRPRTVPGAGAAVGAAVGAGDASVVFVFLRSGFVIVTQLCPDHLFHLTCSTVVLYIAYAQYL